MKFKEKILNDTSILLSLLLSYKKISNLSEPIRLKLENGCYKKYPLGHEEYYTFDIFPHIYEKCIQIIIELAINLRRFADNYFGLYGEKINDYVINNSIGELSFYDSLNKIIHAVDLELETEDEGKNKYFGYSGPRKCGFTNRLYVKGYETDGITSWEYFIDLKLFCLNILVLSSKMF